jgi:hypothetical protein
MTEVWNSEVSTEEWNKGIIVPIHKKGSQLQLPPSHNCIVLPGRPNFTILFEFQRARVGVSEEPIYTEASRKRRSAVPRCNRQVQCHCELAKVYTLHKTGKLRLENMSCG